MLISLKVYKEGFNEKIRIGDSLEYAGYKYIIIRILEIKKLYFSKSIRLEIDVLAQKVGEPTNCNEYKKQAQLIDRYDQSRDTKKMVKVGDIIFAEDRKWLMKLFQLMIFIMNLLSWLLNIQLK